MGKSNGSGLAEYPLTLILSHQGRGDFLRQETGEAVSVWFLVAFLLLFSIVAPVSPLFAQEAADKESAWSQRCAGVRTSYNPDADLSNDAFTLSPDDVRWLPFLNWTKEQGLFTFSLRGFQSYEPSQSDQTDQIGQIGTGIIFRWAEGTAWQKDVLVPFGQALAHMIAERKWRDVDFPEFFAAHGGLYDINLAERLALIDPKSLAPWQLFFATITKPDNAAARLLDARLAEIGQEGQSASITLGPDRTVSYSAERILLDFKTVLTDCQVYAFFQAYDQPGELKAAASAAPEPISLERGQQIYEQECSACHGVNGDGQGLLASALTPRPRDFSRALYRYRSTPTGQLPTDADLQRTVRDGLTGSGMPAFGAVLNEAAIRNVVAYIKQFSTRFETQHTPQPLAIPQSPSVSPERIARGAQLYRDSGCPSCHGDTGKGDGRSGQDLKTSEGDPIRPRNLTNKWNFQGGHAPQDVFLRLAAGMDGSSMASYGDALTADEIWDVVVYVLSLSPEERPKIQPAQARAKARTEAPAKVRTEARTEAAH